MLIPTWRSLILALLSLPVIAASGSAGTGASIALVWLLGVVVVAVIDSRFVPVRHLRWSRGHDEKLSLGVWNPVALTLHNSSSYRLTLRARDTVPQGSSSRAGDEQAKADTAVQGLPLYSVGEAGEGVCEARGEWLLDYRVFPVRRGDYSFGPINARYLSPLRLVWRQHSFPLDDPIKVYPNLRAIRSYEALLQRGQLQEIGLRNSRRWGTGTEFERLRDYTPDDEYRRINWAATARRHKLIAVEYETERSQNVILALDTGRLMSVQVPAEVQSSSFKVQSGARTGSTFNVQRSTSGLLRQTSNVKSQTSNVSRRTRREKRENLNPEPGTSSALTRLDYAVNASLLLAFVAQQRGDRVGLVAFSDIVKRYVPPRSGRRGFLTVVEALYDVEADATEADYGDAVVQLAARSARRSLVVLFTDVVDPEAGTSLAAQIGHLARRHLVLVVTLRDPAVEHLASVPPTSSRSVYERAVAQTLLEEREETLLSLRQRGALTLDVAADQISPATINRYLEIKARTAL